MTTTDKRPTGAAAIATEQSTNPALLISTNVAVTEHFTLGKRASRLRTRPKQT